MADEVININTGRREQRNPSHWAMVEQLIGAEGVVEIIRIMADICADIPDVNPLLNSSATREINERVAEILRRAAGEIEDIDIKPQINIE